MRDTSRSKAWAAALMLLLGLAGCTPRTGAPAAPAKPGATPPNMERYQLVLLRRGPAWTPKLTPEVRAIGAGHMANIRRLAAEGKLLIAGPFLAPGPTGLAGLFIFKVGSVEEARSLVDTDPAVKAGRLVAEIVPWLGPRGLTYAK